MESQVQSESVALSAAIRIAKLVNLASIIYKQAVKENDTATQLNPSLKAYENVCNNEAYQDLVDKDFMTDYNVLYNIQMNDILIPGDLDLVYYGFIAQHKKTKNYAIAIRGTENNLEVIADAFLIPTKFKEFANKSMVPAGFYDLYESALIVSPPDTKPQIVPLLLKIVAANPTLMMPDAMNVRTTVTGHSLGSALATYYAAAASLGQGRNLDLNVYTFASPNTGNATFAATYNNNVPNNCRVYNVPDVVPKVPQFFENGVNIYTQVAGGKEIDSSKYPKVKAGAPCAHQLPVYQYVLLNEVYGTDNPDILNFDNGGCKAS